MRGSASLLRSLAPRLRPAAPVASSSVPARFLASSRALLTRPAAAADDHASLAASEKALHPSSHAVRATVYSNQRASDFAAHSAAFPSWPGPFAPRPARATLSVDQFRARYADLEPGSRLEDEPPSTLCGRIVSVRIASKALVFVDIAAHSLPMGPALVDPSSGGVSAPTPLTRANVQLILSSRRLTDDARALARLLRRGDWVSATGIPGSSKTRELSLVASDVSLLSPCLQPLPPALTNPELRARERHVDLIVNQAATWATFRARTLATAALRAFLTGNGFVEVETPVLWPQAGGANARPFVTESNALTSHSSTAAAAEGGEPAAASFELSLRIAPELFHKQLVIGGFERVFEIGKVFRNEGIDATHSPEFTSCEAYLAHADYEDAATLTELALRAMVRAATGGSEKVAVRLHKNAHADALASPLVKVLALSEGESAVVEAEGEAEGEEGSGAAADAGTLVELDFSAPFDRIDIVSGLAALGAPLPPNFNDPSSLPALLAVAREAGVAVPQSGEGEAWVTNAKVIDCLISSLLEPRCVGPTLLMHPPVCLSPLAKRHNDRPDVAERFELFINTKEYCNAYSELNNPREQLARFKDQQAAREGGDAEAHPVDTPYCEALETGLPPTAGWGLGIDRLAMLLSGTQNIRDVLLFPIMKPKTASNALTQAAPSAKADASKTGAVENDAK